MAAPVRVLPREKCRAPRLALVDNVGIGEDIVAEAQRQNLRLIDGLEPERLATPVNRSRRRERRVRHERNGPVTVSFIGYAGPVHPEALRVAQEIRALHGGYIRVVNETTVLVLNHPPERERNELVGEGSETVRT